MRRKGNLIVEKGVREMVSARNHTTSNRHFPIENLWRLRRPAGAMGSSLALIAAAIIGPVASRAHAEAGRSAISARTLAEPVWQPETVPDLGFEAGLTSVAAFSSSN